MRVLLSTFGSRGDVQPLAALGAALQARGADAVVSAPTDQEFVDLLARAGVPMAPAFTALRPWHAEVTRDGPVDLPTLARSVMRAQFDAVMAAAEGCNVLVGNGVYSSAAAARTVAEALGMPYVAAAYCPLFLPSPHQRPFPFPSHPFPPGETDNGALWAHDARAMGEIFGEALNELRAYAGLPPIDGVRDHVLTARPWLAADPALGPWRGSPWLEVVQTGAWLLKDGRPLDPDLTGFLEAGDPPVYVGFGSMALREAEAVARAAVEAARAHGRRVLVSRGWAELGLIDEGEDCFATGEANQQALFPRVACVVHHGGAGTTHAAAMAGVPQVIAPQMMDQGYWGERVAALGIGAAHAGPALTPGSLRAALDIALSDSARTRAAAFGPTMRRDGAETAARLLLET